MRRRDFALGLAAFAAIGEVPRAGFSGDGPAERMVRLINAIRGDKGLGALRLDARLIRAAQALARDMARTGNLAHRASDGSDLGARLARAGYGYRVAAENIAYGFAAPEATVDQWLASEGHRRNMLLPAVNQAGVGFAVREERGRRPRPYWVLVLAAPPQGDGR